MIKKNCDNCGHPHEVKAADLKRGWGRTCSKSCAASIKARKPNSNYKKFLRRKAYAEEQEQNPTFSNAHQFSNQGE